MDGWMEKRFLGMECLDFSIFAHVEVEKIKDMHDFWGSCGTKKQNSAFSTRIPSKPLNITSHDVKVDLNAFNAKEYRNLFRIFVHEYKR